MANKKKYAMKRKRYGWGFTPVTWQGWLFLVSEIATLVVAASFLPHKPQHPTTAQLVKFLVILGLVILSIVLGASMAGPKPHWRWGKKASDNPSEDF